MSDLVFEPVERPQTLGERVYLALRAQLLAGSIEPGQPLQEVQLSARLGVSRTPVRAAILLAETGRLASFERFSFALDDVMTTANEHQMLFDIAAGYLEMRAAVRGAKAGLGRGLVAPDAVFPLMSLPTSPRTGSAEPALVLALSRQES